MEFSESVRFDDINIKLQMENLQINVLYIRYELGLPTDFNAYHCHGSYELHFIFKGEGQVRLADRTLRVSPGIFYMTGPGIYHEQTFEKANPACELCMNFDIKILKKKPPKSPSIQGEVDNIITILKNNKFWFGQDTLKTAELLNAAISELYNREIGYSFSVQNLLSQVIIQLARCFSRSEKSMFSIPKKIPEQNRRLLIDSFFETEIHKSPSPKTLAEILGVSVRHLHRILLQDYNMGFKEKELKTKIVIIKNLLQSTTLSTETIAEKAGFLNLSHFTRVFKSFEGIAPAQYRKTKLY